MNRLLRRTNHLFSPLTHTPPPPFLQARKADQVAQSAASFKDDCEAAKARILAKEELKAPLSIEKKGPFAVEQWKKQEAEKRRTA